MKTIFKIFLIAVLIGAGYCCDKQNLLYAPNPNVTRKAITHSHNPIPAIPALIGQVAGNDFTSGNWTQAGASTSYTFNANSIDIIGTSGAYTALIRYNQYFSQSDAGKLTSIYTVNTVTSTNVFLGTGFRDVSTFSTNRSFWISMWTNVANQGWCELYYGDGNLVAGGAGSVLSFSVGNQIKTTLAFSNNGLNVTATIQNYTTLGPVITLTYTNPNAFVYPGTTAPPTIYQPAFNCYKGNYTINSWTYEVNEYNNIDLVLIGDSKTEGYYGGTYPNTIAGLWKSNNPTKYIQVEAGSGEVTQDILNAMPEILLMKPKKAILCIGRNDVADGVATATWQANYTGIVNQLQAIGCTVYHQVHLTEAAGGSGYNTLITFVNTFPNVIQLPGTWDGTTDNAGDGVHPNTTGALKIYTNQAATLPAL